MEEVFLGIVEKVYRLLYNFDKNMYWKDRKKRYENVHRILNENLICGNGGLYFGYVQL